MSDEVWEPLKAGKASYSVSTHGRVKGRLGRIIPPLKASIARGEPTVLIDGYACTVRSVVASVFGKEAGAQAALMVLGEGRLLRKKAKLEAELERVSVAVVALRSPRRARGDSHVYEIAPGQDVTELGVPACSTPRELALEEARWLGAVYRSGVAVDPDTGLTRAQLEQRLVALRARYGAVIETESQVRLPPMPPSEPDLFHHPGL